MFGVLGVLRVLRHAWLSRYVHNLLAKTNGVCIFENFTKTQHFLNRLIEPTDGIDNRTHRRTVMTSEDVPELRSRLPRGCDANSAHFSDLVMARLGELYSALVEDCPHAKMAASSDGWTMANGHSVLSLCLDGINPTTYERVRRFVGCLHIKERHTAYLICLLVVSNF